ncbi:uncharacterized protein LOC142336123 [Convolutriloba macropyga]|uniref:uncharacterized protein LOC142336123 n=1 Tax=Convolutriloba macropyga TaxID=536237 RepID=UPI003F523803
MAYTNFNSRSVLQRFTTVSSTPLMKKLSYSDAVQKQLPENASISSVNVVGYLNEETPNYVKSFKNGYGQVIFVGGGCILPLMSRNCRNRSHVGFVQAIIQKSELSFEVIVECLMKCGCESYLSLDLEKLPRVSHNPFYIKCSASMVKPVDLSLQRMDECKKNDVCQFYVPSIDHFILGYIKNVDGDTFEVKVMAAPSYEIPSERFNYGGVLKFQSGLRFLVHKCLCKFAFRPIQCQKNDLCEVYFFDRTISGRIKKVTSNFYLIKFETKPRMKSALKFYATLQHERESEWCVSKHLARPQSSHNLPESDWSIDSNENDPNDVPILDPGLSTEKAPKLENFPDVIENDALLEKFCYLENYVAFETCGNEDHFGHVFVVLIDNGQLMAGIELLNACTCALICDGSYRGKLYNRTRKKQMCLFVPRELVVLIEFAEIDDQPFEKNDICEVFVPQMKEKFLVIYGGKCKDDDNLSTVKLLNNAIGSILINRKSNYLQANWSSSGKLVAKVDNRFVKFVFRPSNVEKDDRCEVFVPNQGLRDGLVLRRGATVSCVVFNENAIREKDLTVDSVFFYSQPTEHDCTFKMQNNFLRKKVIPVEPSNSQREQSDGKVEHTESYVVINQVDECEEFNSATGNGNLSIQLNEQFYSADSVTTNSRMTEQTNSRPLPVIPKNDDYKNNEHHFQAVKRKSALRKDSTVDDRFVVTDKASTRREKTSTSAESIPVNAYDFEKPFKYTSMSENQSIPNIYIKPDDFCYIDEAYMYIVCEVKYHFGNVFAIINNEKGGATVGVRLIDRCRCKTVGDGMYKKQFWAEQPQRERCLFVPASKVNVIEFRPHASDKLLQSQPTKINDICDIFVPTLQKKYIGICSNLMESGSLEVQILDQNICIMPKYDEIIEGVQKCIKRDNLIFYDLRTQFVKPLFSPIDVKETDICNLFVPDQGLFQCLAENVRLDGKIEVSLLEGSVDMKSILVDPTFFTKTESGNYIVIPQFLLSLVATDNDFGPSARMALERIDSGDESVDPLVCDRDTVDKAARKFAERHVHFGRNKGIQGHHNSCYMDSLFYSLFLFSDSLDAIWDINKTKGVKAVEMQNNLKTMIVNPLRSDNCFVPAGNVLALRKQLEKWLPGVMSEEKDAEELLSVLFSKHFVGGDGYPPLLHITNVTLNEDQDLFVYQVFVEPEDEQEYKRMLKIIPSVQDILAQSFVLQGQFFRQNPNCFLIQLPRFGKEKLFPGIYLPVEIDISNISLSTYQLCCICDDNQARLRCKICSISKTDKLFGGNEEEFNIAQFCEDCYNQTHKSGRKNHGPDKIPPATSSFNGTTYVLDAVICIQTSHYVSFVRTKLDSAESKPTWLFFDSMADREEDFYSRRADNVPQVSECPTIEGHLKHLKGMKEAERFEYLQRYSMQDEMLKRLVQDAYIGVYKQIVMESQV